MKGLDRFELGERLGAGGQGHTVRAVDRQTGADVVVKELDLSRVESAKALELFAREAEILSELNHPAIPRYVASFSEGSGRETRYFLVQQFVRGQTLEQVIDDGRRWTEDEAGDLLRQLLEILVYLQSREPPVIHRDIKPANVLVRDDNTLALVDFGAAQVVTRETYADSTIIGTSGYMAPEQFTGRAVPASDVYGVGATVLHALSHRHPGEMPTKNLGIDFTGLIRVSPELSMYLERLVAPVLEDRFPNAAEALALLERLDTIGEYEPPPDHTMMTRVGPPRSRVVVRRTKEALHVTLPPAPRRLMLATWAALWLIAFAVVLPVMGEFSQLWYWGSIVLVPLVIGTVRELKRFERVRLTVDRRSLTATRKLLRTETVEMETNPTQDFGPTSHHIQVEAVAIDAILGARRRPHEVVVENLVGKFAFGQYLSPTERNWVVDELRTALEDVDPPIRARASEVVLDLEATEVDKRVVEQARQERD